jgi:hypothetical protein
MIALLLRGHIRNSFENNRLNEFITFLFKKYGYFHIYIQTWKNIENKPGHSWRTVYDVKQEIKKKDIKNYFEKKYLIKHIMILDDTMIDDELEGDVCGIIPNTLANKKGWKYMWYGKFQIAKHIYETKQKYDLVINTRFDIFSTRKKQLMYNLKPQADTKILNNILCSSFKYTTIYEIFNSIILNYKLNKELNKDMIIFQFEEYKPEIDNFYVCSKEQNYITYKYF